MTTGKPDDSTSIPGDAKARMDRILRLHAEVDTIKEMIREVYGEEKDAGGDKTAMGVAVSIIRKRSKDSDKFDNQQGMVDLYLTAFAGASHTHAYARDDEHDPETGEIHQPETANEAGDDAIGHVATDAADHGPVDADAETLPAGGENVTTSSAHIVAGEGAHNASVTTFTPKPLRPHCLNPGNNCGGQGRKHCFKCQKAHDEAQGAA